MQAGAYRGFLLDVDLTDLSVRGYPRPVAFDGCAVLLAGHLARRTGCDRDDPRTLARMYRRHGGALSAHLLGQYAAVIVDQAKEHVVLAQDSLGLGSLFYRLNGVHLVAASDLAMLLGYIGVPDLDEHYFAEQFATGYAPRTRTPFTDVRRVAYGHTVTIDRSTVRHTQPWRPAGEPIDISRADAETRLGELLDEAVAAVLPDSGSVVCELSGGLDSSTVLATAAARRPDIHALTLISSSERAGDDEVYAGRIVERFGVSHHTIDIDAHPFFSAMPDRFTAESGGEFHVAAQDAYEKVLDHVGAAVVLTGNPGDVIFGYGGLPPVHLADPLVNGRLLRAVRDARHWADTEGAARPWSFLLAHYGLVPAWKHARRQSLLKRPADPPDWVSPTLLKAFGSRRRQQPAPRVPKPGQQYLWEQVLEIAAGTQTSLATRSRAEFRHPLFHRPLVDFLIGLDPRMHRGPDGDRLLQRSALRGVLPDAVLDRETKGSSQQLREQALMRNEMFHRVMTVDSRLVQRGWVDPAGWKTVLDRARVGVFDGSLSCEAAFLTEIWLRTIETCQPRRVPQLFQPVDAEAAP